MKKSIKDYKSIGDFAYAMLKNEILTLRLEPGRKISETEIANTLAISRTPVREAIIKLSQEGMLKVQAQRGTYVSKIDLSFVEEARFMRRTLEEKVVSEAILSFSKKDEDECHRILFFHKQVPDNNYKKHFFYDALFHRAIYASAGKGRIWDAIDSFNWDYRRVRYLTLIELPKIGSIIQDHETIFDAILRKDTLAAQEATCRHLDHWVKERISISAQHSDYFSA